MTYVEFNLIRAISVRIITAAIAAAYCSFAYLLCGALQKLPLSFGLLIFSVLQKYQKTFLKELSKEGTDESNKLA